MVAGAAPPAVVTDAELTPFATHFKPLISTFICILLPFKIDLLGLFEIGFLIDSVLPGLESILASS